MKALAPVARSFPFQQPRHQGPFALDLLAYDRIAIVAVGAAISILPVLNPKGPLNVAPVDLIMASGIIAVILWAGASHTGVHAPYVIPLTGLLVTGLVAALVGNAPKTGGTAVIQEIFLLGWCAAITTLVRTPRALRAVVRTWSLSSIVWGVILLLAEAGGVASVPGGSGGLGGRSRLWFDHPNLAGNYFAVAVFVVLATRYPRRRALRIPALMILIAAVALTGSNTALLTLPLGGLVIAFIRFRQRHGTSSALAVVLTLVIATAAAWAALAGTVATVVEDTDAPIVRYSVGRYSKSASSRESLFRTMYELFREGTQIGVGPSATKQALADLDAPVAKQAHNDYLATLVERGPLGVVALVGLIAAIAFRAGSIQRLAPRWASVIPNPAALAAVLVGFLLTALTHEVLHYRHFWTLLAVVAALHLYGTQRPIPAAKPLERGFAGNVAGTNDVSGIP